MKKLMYALMGLSLFAFLGCGANDADTVKNSKLPNYPDATVGQAWGAAFDEGKWSAQKLADGQQQVIFEGKISQLTHARAVERFIAGNTTEVDMVIIEEDPVPQDGRLSTGDEVIVEGEDALEAGKEGIAASEQAEEKAAQDTAQAADAAATTAQQAANDQLLNEQTNVDIQALDKIWPVGAIVKFVWTSPKGGKEFTVTEFTNEYWANSGASLEDVLAIIYAAD